MNKYQKALDDLDVPFESYKLLKELVEKAIPKKTKVIEDRYSWYFDCPNCGISTWCDGDEKEHKYCFNCGQALDWSEEDEG